jgi:hypothetical protein
MSANEQILIGVIVVTGSLALGTVVFFIVLREFWTWFWKQSAQVEGMQAQEELLARMTASLEAMEARSRAPSPSTAPPAGPPAPRP